MFCDNGKICFDSPKEAATAAANLSKHDKKNKYSFYKCSFCKKFHTNTVKKKKKLLPKKADKYPFRYRPFPKDDEPVKKNKKGKPRR